MMKDKYLLKILLAASKKAETQKRLQSEPPTKVKWLDIVTRVQNMERMIFSLNLQMDKYLQYWEKLIVFMTCLLSTVSSDIYFRQYDFCKDYMLNSDCMFCFSKE